MRRLVFVILALAAAASAGADPARMSRDEIIDLARTGVDYSYWWGHDQWRHDGTQLGSCSGSCPNCTHSGSYGADCSGYVAKVWQVPSPIDITTYSHPYSTESFRYASHHWDQVSRADAVRGDAMVYRNSANTGGHIVLYESGDPWGSSWVYEAKGCAYGIVHNLKSVSSSYVAIRRHNIDDTPSEGVIQGVVFEDTGAGTADMSVRIPGAVVSISGGGSVTARDDDAFWSFSLPQGNYSITVTADGYETGTTSCTANPGGETWCSVGLHRSCVPDCAGRACGPDPVCGTSCGGCPAGHTCTADGQCACQPDCSQRTCGPDPVCGASCGECPAGTACSDAGECLCQPDCGGRVCGPDPVCGTDCGTCPAGKVCNPAGQCEPAGCEPDCAGRACGPDPVCGASCGMCPPETACDPDGQCVPLGVEEGKFYGYVMKFRNPDEVDDPMNGTPVAGARVRAVYAENSETVADEHGYYELVLAPGTQILSASADGYFDGEATCAVGPGGAVECTVPVYTERGPDPVDDIVIRGGCATAPATGSTLLPLLLLLLPAVRRRRSV